jgi:hypothetical protein
MTITAVLAIGVATMPLAGCGDGDETTTVTESVPTETAPTEGPTGPTGAEGETTTPAESASPVQELVGGATRRIPSEVDCDAAPDATTGTCQVEDTEIVVADAGETLELDTVTVRLGSLEATKRVNAGGRARIAKGVFLLGKLTVGNLTSQPETFDVTGRRTQLKVGRATYNQDDQLTLHLPSSFFVKDKEIRPQTTQVGTVPFDVPESALDVVEERGAIVVLNIGHKYEKFNLGLSQRLLDPALDQVGLIRTSEVRQGPGT